MDISQNNNIYNIFREILKEKVSDIHVLEWKPVYVRNATWSIVHLDQYILAREEIWWFLQDFLKDDKLDKLLNWTEVDVAFKLDNTNLRINAYMDRNWIRMAIRKISSNPPSMDQVWLPEYIQKFLNRDKWLILVTWPTWSWKSTTMASMIDYINTNRNVHVITMEDPIEYVFENKNSLITQREIWRNSWSWNDAMKYALRQDPDVIMVWEMRDVETISSVLTLVETWHLVISTLHTVDAAQTITRIIDVFPPHKQDQIAVQLSLSLDLVISQRLFATKEWGWRVPAREILVNSTAVANNIRERKVPQITSIMETWFKYGMKTMDQSLAELVIQWKVDLNEVIPSVKSVETFKTLLNSMRNDAKSFRPVD